ncbi:MAG TPA: sigma-70 family RNA polymerase sigma factor, partial [Kofleriaceae bacterium]
MQSAAAIEAVFRRERARVLATTIRVTHGDFDLAEEAVQDAFAAAIARWPVEGTPEEPRGWLISVARHKAIDTIRRRVKLREIVSEQAAEATGEASEDAAPAEPVAVADDRLRLIYTCCHPALATEAQIALTLRTLGGLTTEEIARAFLTSAVTMAQRLVRAKSKIRDAGIPYEVPEASQLPERTGAVMAVVYLIFNEGYAATAGDAWIRRDLCREAIRLGRLVAELTGAPEARGLLALMLLHDARRDARTDEHGDVVLLEDQDRARWDQAQIAEALALVPDALRGGPGPYSL